ncbi:hypothetical protein [Variovorax rhizosphaerae]|uniref:Protein-glutamine glutaminase n=1 Tax=Variovorax rhizosphaerae TaxID=1836200 RepID=A0ABU8WX96_9BURK
MLERHVGLDAPYFEGTCTWVMADGAGVLTSSSFGSCVGLVLYGPRHQRGVVAHFAGELGLQRANVRRYTTEILRQACPVLPGPWTAWVFGGASLCVGTDAITMTAKSMTMPLINAVRQALRVNPYIPVNVLRRAAALRGPETQEGTYTSHTAVALDVATGIVTWPRVANLATQGGSEKVVVLKRKTSM